MTNKERCNPQVVAKEKETAWNRYIKGYVQFLTEPGLVFVIYSTDCRYIRVCESKEMKFAEFGAFNTHDRDEKDMVGLNSLRLGHRCVCQTVVADFYGARLVLRNM